MARLDPHSYADDQQPQTAHLELSLRVDFAETRLYGELNLHFAAPGQGTLDLDTRDLELEAVTSLQGAPLPHKLAPPDSAVPYLGSRLRIELPPASAGVRLRYRTSQSASALQWLSPEQTAGKVHPFLYSQCQPIHARSIAPLQDTPRIRVRARVSFTVPAQLRALMAAAPLGRTAKSGAPGSTASATDSFEMQQPIPSYLLAFAVGDLAPRQLSVRSAVWAERSVVDAAAHEFDGVEELLLAAEELFGPYEWDRFDLLVLPPSFPYGGMENPRLTFVTPSLLAGDRSLVNVIAHELAHAWTGNLVTNASANDFWLNEGFTVYAEQRILEALEGREAAELHAAIGMQELSRGLEQLASRPELTRLRNELGQVDPDLAYSSVPYWKGYLLLRRFEELAGRPKWDAFLLAYLERFRFRSIVTEDFLRLLEEKLPGLSARADALRWIDQPGLPADAPWPRSQRLAELEALARRAGAGLLPAADEAKKLTPTELLVLLQSLPSITPETCAALEARFDLANRPSLELRHHFVLAQLRAVVPGAVEAARQLLLSTGRMKYLRTLYKQLHESPGTRAAAASIYAEAKAGYHPIARAVVEAILG